MPTLYLASDPLGNDLRAVVEKHLQQQHPDVSVQDLGNFDKYYEAAHKVGSLVQLSRSQGGADRAVLFCGTGMGMSIIANKFPDVYAAVVESVGAAGNAAAINQANVLSLGGMMFKPEEATAAVDKWLGTAFKAGYEQYTELLDASMKEIPALVHGTAGPVAAPEAAAAAAAGGDGNSGTTRSSSGDTPGIPYPSAALYVEGGQGGCWRPIEAMGHDSCVWCLLREDLAQQQQAATAAAGEGGGGGGAGGPTSTRVRALVRFPAGAREPPHHHSHGHDLLVLSGCQSLTDHTANQTWRLGPCSYLYTPAHHSHSVEYHADTMFFIGFDGPGALDIVWDDPSRQGVEWSSQEARQAAEENQWTPPAGLGAEV